MESKQRIGTLIRDPQSAGHRMRKQTSKRDQAVVAIKKMVIDQQIEPGQTLPSAREIAKIIGSAPNTTRLALEFLSGTGVLKSLDVLLNNATLDNVMIDRMTINTGGFTFARSFSSCARRLDWGSDTKLRSPVARRSKAINDEGVSFASFATREAAGCRRSCNASKSRPRSVMITISPSTTHELCSSSRLSAISVPWTLPPITASRV